MPLPAMTDATPKPPADATIPILMEPVAAETAPPAEALQDARPLERQDQQSLFDDIPAAVAVPKPPRKPVPTPAERLQAARDMLRMRAPAIVEEVTAAHRQQLTEALRARLQAELASLLDDLTPPGNDS